MADFYSVKLKKIKEKVGIEHAVKRGGRKKGSKNKSTIIKEGLPSGDEIIKKEGNPLEEKQNVLKDVTDIQKEDESDEIAEEDKEETSENIKYWSDVKTSLGEYAKGYEITPEEISTTECNKRKIEFQGQEMLFLTFIKRVVKKHPDLFLEGEGFPNKLKKMKEKVGIEHEVKKGRKKGTKNKKKQENENETLKENIPEKEQNSGKLLEVDKKTNEKKEKNENLTDTQEAYFKDIHGNVKQDIEGFMKDLGLQSIRNLTAYLGDVITPCGKDFKNIQHTFGRNKKAIMFQYYLEKIGKYNGMKKGKLRDIVDWLRKEYEKKEQGTEDEIVDKKVENYLKEEKDFFATSINKTKEVSKKQKSKDIEEISEKALEGDADSQKLIMEDYGYILESQFVRVFSAKESNELIKKEIEDKKNNIFWKIVREWYESNKGKKKKDRSDFYNYLQYNIHKKIQMEKIILENKLKENSGKIEDFSYKDYFSHIDEREIRKRIKDDLTKLVQILGLETIDDLDIEKHGAENMHLNGRSIHGFQNPTLRNYIIISKNFHQKGTHRKEALEVLKKVCDN